MAQHDYVIANGTGAAVRSDLNGSLAAIVSNNSGATEPGTMYAYQWWPDTTTGLLKQRNAANNAWVTVGTLASTNLGLLSLAGGTMTGALAVTAGTAALPGIAVSGDLNTGIFSPGADTLALVTAGTNRLHVTSAGLVGIGDSAPESLLHLKGSNATLKIESSVNTGYSGVEFDRAADDTLFAIYAYDSSHASQANNVQFYGYQNGNIQFITNGNATPRLTITSAGLVGIGTTSTSNQAHIYRTDSGTSNGALRLDGNGSYAGVQFAVSGTNYGSICSDTASFYITHASSISFRTGGSGNVGGTDRACIDSSGRLLVGTSSARTAAAYGAAGFQVESTYFANSSFSAINNQATSDGSALMLGKSRGTSNGSTTIVQAGDTTGYISFQGADGTNLKETAAIFSQVDGTPGANDMPGRLVFTTTADGASSPTEAMRIGNAGDVLVAKTTLNDLSVIGIQLGAGTFKGTGFFTAGDESGLFVNRQNSDGSLVNFYQANTIEGTISVSGTTVSYNGAHLSRWSQLPSGAERTEILRGSILSNIDEMCEWGDEENEQLNRMKVSDVEGDKNVSGVFQAWDDDDDTYTDDFYCAMTGDFIIRIGDGVTVERGDLLMSAGDGTAKPQDDDIIRSKTLAKVTSTNVSCTYEDGSYCVPCVLMAC